MSSRIPSHTSISHRAQLYGNFSKPGSTSQSNPSPPSTDARTASETSDASPPDLGEGLSTDERRMIHDKFPPSPQTTMRIYGRDRGEQNLHPGSLGNEIDLRG
jgi:hypothetical protein